MSTALFIVIAVVIFGLLITVHELGHFLAARACGVRVLEFAIGMGPAITQKTTKSGTKVSWRWLPFGGYCAMEGEDSASDDPQAFTNAAMWKKLVILLAGAAMNFLLGFVLIFVCFSQQDSFMTPTLTSFMEGCPYEGEDGLQVGDVFYKIDGHRIYTSSDVSLYLLRSESDTKDIVVIRDGEKVEISDFYLVQRDYTDEQTGQTAQYYGFRFGVKETGFGAQLKYTWYCSLDFIRQVWMGLGDLITGRVGINQMTGVVGIVDVIAQVGTQSPSAYDAILNIIYLTAFITVNLAVMNLLPIPALDGGRIFFLVVTWIVEHITRRRVDPKYEGYINTAGLLLLMALMVYVMYNDIARIITR